MAIARIEPSGCVEFHGNVQVRLAFYLEPDDARYDERHYLVPIIPKKGYPGRVDELGSPPDPEEYQRWLNSLPKKWILAPFHNHFLYLPPDATEDIIAAKANFHLPNFYAAWLQELDKIPGGMRRGWATETRTRPTRYDRADPELYKLRKPQCLEKAQLIRALAIEVKRKEGGQLFPATAIDIGAAAIDRGSYGSLPTYILKDNPANDTGTITSVEIFAKSGADLADCEVATFEEVSANTFTTRDSETIGAVVGGSKHTSSGLDMDVTVGDYIGTYYSSGHLERELTGGADIWYLGGDYIPCTNETFSVAADDILSLYGTGETGAATYEESCTDGLVMGEPATTAQLTIGLSVTDGLKAGDTPASLGIFNALASEGAVLSETLATLLETYPALVDGLVGNDAPSIFLTIGKSLADGLKLSEVLSHTYESNPVATDGIILSGLSSTLAILNALSSDGIVLGDTPLTNLITTLLATDGLVSGDTPSIFLTIEKSLRDGVKLSDTLTHLFETNPTLADGIKLSDAVAILLEANPSVSDGVKLSDTLAHLFETSPSLADGIKFGDTPATQIVFGILAADGIKLSDMPTATAILNALASDGIKLSDVATIYLTIALALSDGVKLSDATISTIKRLAKIVAAGALRGITEAAKRELVDGAKRDITDSTKLRRIT